jgi:hypothetical protein
MRCQTLFKKRRAAVIEHQHRVISGTIAAARPETRQPCLKIGPDSHVSGIHPRVRGRAATRITGQNTPLILPYYWCCNRARLHTAVRSITGRYPKIEKTPHHVSKKCWYAHPGRRAQPEAPPIEVCRDSSRLHPSAYPLCDITSCRRLGRFSRH